MPVWMLRHARSVPKVRFDGPVVACARTAPSVLMARRRVPLPPPSITINGMGVGMVQTSRQWFGAVSGFDWIQHPNDYL
jgi:Asp/Glu/hydantoin racemase